MTYKRKPRNQEMENQDKSFQEDTKEEKSLPTIEEVEENIKKVIEINKMLEETLEKLEALPAPTGKIFIGEEDKRLLKKFNQHIIKKLGIAGNRSFKL